MPHAKVYELSKTLRAIRVGAAVLIAALALSLAGGTTNTQAQLSCDTPPIDVSRLVQVWDKTDFCTYQDGVYEEIISGGVPRDGIPPIDDPEFESIDAASGWLETQSPMLVLEVGGVARAYPLAIMTRHEIVNDVINGMPIAVTFCPLCNSGLAYDRQLDGETLRFGVSGLLRNSDLIMWDDLTQTWWQQFTGVGIVGKYTGVQLTPIATQMVSFGAFVKQFPKGEVLSRRGRSYGSNPYVGYDTDSTPFLFTGTPDERLFPTERVLAGVVGGVPIAYPFGTLEEAGVINDTVGGKDVVAFWQPGAASALDTSDIDSSRDVGMAALYSRALDDMVLTFSLDESGTIRDDQTDSAWNVFGHAVAGDLEGSQLRQVLAAPHFWFAWAAFEPETDLYGQAD